MPTLNPVSGNCPECLVTPLTPCNGGDVVVLAPNTQVVYVAQRGDGVDGVGDERDPRDGSTAAKLDALMLATPASRDIVFLPGIYETVTGITMKANWRLRGSGPQLTTLRLKANSITTANTSIRLINNATNGYEYLEVSDLSTDCNLDNQSAVTGALTGVQVWNVVLTGRNCLIDNVRATGAYSNNGEIFPVMCGCGETPTDSRAYRGTILNTTFRDGRGAVTAMCVLNFLYGAGTFANANYIGTIENCSVTDNIAGAAYQISGVSKGTLRNCHSFNTGLGFYVDTSTHWNLTIEDNTFVDLRGNGIHINTAGVGQTKGCSIRNNTTRARAGSEASVGHIAVNGDATDFIIEGNTMDSGSYSTNQWFYAFNAATATVGGVFRDNIISNGLVLDSTHNTTGNTKFAYSGNRYMNGHPAVDVAQLSPLRESVRVRQSITSGTQGKIPIGQCFNGQQVELDIAVKVDIAGWLGHTIVMRAMVDGGGTITASKVRGPGSPIFQLYYNSLGSGVYALFIGNNTNAVATGNVDVSIVGTPLAVTANNGSGATAVSYT